MKSIKVIVARHRGFCFGVRRAVGLANKTLDAGGKDIYSLGPLIHNSEVVRELSRRGLKVVSSLRKIKKGSILIIRSHGLLPQLIQKAKRRQVKMVDATCPFVKKAQRICQVLSKDGYGVVVVGDRFHPEVKTLVGLAGKDVVVLEGFEDLGNFKIKSPKIGIVAQTTQSRQNYSRIANALMRERFSGNGVSELRVFDTICLDTAKRQSEAKRISKRCDRMIVIGGKNSANSRRLAEICKNTKTKTIHIERATQIEPQWLKGAKGVGIVSGASTPDSIIDEVIKKLKGL